MLCLKHDNIITTQTNLKYTSKVKFKEQNDLTNKLFGFLTRSKRTNYLDLKVITIYQNFILFISCIFEELELLKTKRCNLRHTKLALVLNKHSVGGTYISCLISHSNKMYVFYCQNENVSKGQFIAQYVLYMNILFR